jgi:hypothetical protein
VKVDEYKVMTECVKEGARRGVNRAFKHTEEPSIEQIIQEVETAVMDSIFEKFLFEPSLV